MASLTDSRPTSSPSPSPLSQNQAEMTPFASCRNDNDNAATATIIRGVNKSSCCSRSWLCLVATVMAISSCHGLSLSSSSRFHGAKLMTTSTYIPNQYQEGTTRTKRRNNIQGGYDIGVADNGNGCGFGSWTMRKQKSSDKRTRRMQQRNGDELTQDLILQSLQQQQQSQSLPTTLTNFPTPNGLTPQQRKRELGHPFVYPHQQKQVQDINNTSNNNNAGNNSKTGGRGRSRKRAALYNTLSSYHNNYLELLTKEYQYEEQEVLGRIKASVDDPMALESTGHALYDMQIERRGNLFSEEVYRLTKAPDAVSAMSDASSSPKARQMLPPNHKFSTNDVMLLTLQPQGSGDFFDTYNLPTASTATSVEARVIGTGPTYVDIVMSSGSMDATFSSFAVNGLNNPYQKLRLRMDRFFSNVPYLRMVNALTQLTALTPNTSSTPKKNEAFKPVDGSSTTASKRNQKNTKNRKGSQSPTDNRNVPTNANGLNDKDDGRTTTAPSPSPNSRIVMDDVFREAIIATHAFTDPSSPLFHIEEACNLQRLGHLLSKPPMPTSIKLANQVLRYIQQETTPAKLSTQRQHPFDPLNGPQLVAVGAALTRKLTMIQGPPGTGKTSTASAIAFGFVHQCQSISPNAKVLASAFSNIGADNLAEKCLSLGLKVVRVGKASAVSNPQLLWPHTLDAAIEQDPQARKAMQNAARATAELAKIRNQRKKYGGNAGSNTNVYMSERMAQQVATSAVKQSIQACNRAAVKAMREADVIVTTCTGAADPRLLAACGLGMEDEDDSTLEYDGSSTVRGKKSGNSVKEDLERRQDRTDAPDGLPPLSLPFVLIDEACQSLEPATLIPLVASNSCRSLVLLGDPCQLPATVKSGTESPLSVSLMERLSATLPPPMSKNKMVDNTEFDTRYLNSLATKQARSLLWARQKNLHQQPTSYRKRYAGSLLLSIQYRMHPSIASFSSAMFYDSLLATPSFLASCRPTPSVISQNERNCAVEMINVGGRCNEAISSPSSAGASSSTTTQPRMRTFGQIPSRESSTPSSSSSSSDSVAGTSLEEAKTYQNEAEAIQVLALIKDILKSQKRNEGEEGIGIKSPTMSIGVVTPYNGQVQLIKRMIANDAELVALLSGKATSTVDNSQQTEQQQQQMSSMISTTVEVKSVDGYQGKERDIIILSTVRSNRKGNIGFVQDWRRLNVALTRAKSALLVVGDIDTLSDGNEHWAAFVKWCQGNNCIR